MESLQTSVDTLNSALGNIVTSATQLANTVDMNKQAASDAIAALQVAKVGRSYLKHMTQVAYALANAHPPQSPQADRSDLDTKANAEQIDFVLATMREITRDLNSNISNNHEVHNSSINILADGMVC